MRCCRRFLITVRIARPAPYCDALDSLREGFAPPHQTLQARCLPEKNDLSMLPAGQNTRESLTLLLPPCADIQPADGVWLHDESKPSFRCTGVKRYPLHVEAQLERRIV